MDQPQPLFDFIFVLFKYKLYGKTVGVNRIRTRIVGVHGEYTDHLTTTAAYLWNVIVWFFLKRPFPVSFLLHILSFPISEQLKYDQKNLWMAGFEPVSSNVGSNQSTNCPTTTSPKIEGSFIQSSNVIILVLSNQCDQTMDKKLPNVYRNCPKSSQIIFYVKDVLFEKAQKGKIILGLLLFPGS